MNIRLKPEFRHALRSAMTALPPRDRFNLRDSVWTAGFRDDLPSHDFGAMYRMVDAYLSSIERRRQSFATFANGQGLPSPFFGDSPRTMLAARIRAWVGTLEGLTREAEQVRADQEAVLKQWGEEDLLRDARARDPVGAEAREAWLDGADP